MGFEDDHSFPLSLFLFLFCFRITRAIKNTHLFSILWQISLLLSFESHIDVPNEGSCFSFLFIHKHCESFLSASMACIRSEIPHFITFFPLWTRIKMVILNHCTKAVHQLSHWFILMTCNIFTAWFLKKKKYTHTHIREMGGTAVIMEWGLYGFSLTVMSLSNFSPVLRCCQRWR